MPTPRHRLDELPKASMPQTEPVAPPSRPREDPEPAPHPPEAPPSQPKPEPDPFNPDWPRTRPTPPPKALTNQLGENLALTPAPPPLNLAGAELNGLLSPALSSSPEGFRGARGEGEETGASFRKLFNGSAPHPFPLPKGRGRESKLGDD